MNINPEFYFVDEQSNHRIVHHPILCKADSITLANFVLARVQMAFVSTPVIGKITGNPKGIDSALYLTLQRRFFHGLLHQQQPSTCLITGYNLPREPFHAG